MSDVDVRAALEIAEEVVKKVDVVALAACGGDESERACVERFVGTFGRRAFRRPLGDAERARFVELFEKELRGTLALPRDEALRLLLGAILQSPQFLYHWERAGALVREDEAVRLGSWEIASRLSFFLWGTMPDEALFADAASGALDTETGVERAARRMIESPRIEVAIRAFHREWLRLDGLGALSKDPSTYPEAVFGPATARSMEAEILALASDVFVHGDGRLETFLRTTKTFVDEPLAKIYGMPEITGAALRPATLDPATRPGLFTRAAFLALGANAYEGDPTKRGKLLREQLLCQALAAPPPGIPPLPSDPDKAVRERHEQHFADPACAACHKLTDGIGFGFEHYDGIGRFRTDDRGRPIDDRGMLVSIDGRDVPFEGAAQLSDLLAGSVEVRRCVAQQWMRFAYGREVLRADEASLQSTWTRFEASGHDVRELLVAIAVSRSFRFRTAADGEGTP
jgi:hypothetical protein